jgi:DNA repair protein RecO (recombination protein O)
MRAIATLSLHKSQAIVLKTYPLGNSDRIVSIYTKDFGKIRGVAKGAQRQKSKFAGRFEMANLIEIVFFEKETNELVSIDSAELLASYSNKISDYEQFLSLSLVVEILTETVPDREVNDPLFRLILLTLGEMQWIDRVGFSRLYFEIWHLKLAGLFPGTKYCRICNGKLTDEISLFFDRTIPTFYCFDCGDKKGMPIPQAVFFWLRTILENPLDRIQDLPSDVTRNFLLQLIDSLLEKSFERKFDSLNLLKTQT